MKITAPFLLWMPHNWVTFNSGFSVYIFSRLNAFASSANTAVSPAVTLRRAINVPVFGELEEPSAQQQAKAAELKQKGNTAHYRRDYEGAVDAYKSALKVNPEYVDAWFNLGHTYLNMGEFKDAITAFQTLLTIQPNDHEAHINLITTLLRVNQANVALAHLDSLNRSAPNFDPANRLAGLERLRYWGKLSNQTVQPIVELLGKHNLTQASKLLSDYQSIAKPDLPFSLSRLSDLAYTDFNDTYQVDYIANLAEYHHQNGLPKGTIRFSPELAFANPAVLAAYWLHEAIHAHDRDGITSVAEEQFAYRQKTLFWQWAKTQANIADPNLDYANSLYSKSPTELDRKVALHYKTRNPAIADTSPYHSQPEAIDKPLYLR